MAGFRFAFEFGWKTYFKFTFQVGQVEQPLASSPSQDTSSPPQLPKLRSKQSPRRLRSRTSSGQETPSSYGKVRHPTSSDSLEDSRRQSSPHVHDFSFEDIISSMVEPQSVTQTDEKPVKRDRNDLTEAVKGSSLFRLPTEVRQIIYKCLLVCENDIQEPTCLLDDMQSLFLNERAKLPAIDGSITRTCRLIEQESNDVLYGHNMFVFKDAEKLRQFGHFNMPGEDPNRLGIFMKEKKTPSWRNRLTLLRSVTIAFQLEHAFMTFRTPHDRKVGRENAWESWKREVFFQQDTYKTPLQFTALENLVLDFTAWQLTADEGLAVQPLIAKFNKSARNLKRVTVRGLQHHGSLSKLKEGFERKGGTLDVQN